MNCVLSTVAVKSVIGQGLGCFCPSILNGGDCYDPMQLIDMFLDGLLEKSWVRGAELEACKSEYQLFVQEQRQLERSSTRGRPDLGSFLTFGSSQSGFCGPRHLYKVCIVFRNVGFSFVGSFGSLMFCFQLTALTIRVPATSDENFTIKLISVAIRKEVVRGVLLCVQVFVRGPVFIQLKLFSETGITMLSEAAVFSDRITSSSISARWSEVESD